jgi:hypothetical protein
MMMRLRHIALILSILLVSATPNFARADACAAAPWPRLSVGDEAMIAPGINRLNLRALPAVDTGVEGQLNAGVRVTVLAGPSCNGHYNWWRVETASGTRGWVAEGDWESYWVVAANEIAAAVDPIAWTCALSPTLLICHLG